MIQVKAYIDNHGKILIPVKLRKRLQLSPYDTLILKCSNNELIITKQNTILSQIQEDFKNRTAIDNVSLDKSSNMLDYTSSTQFDKDNIDGDNSGNA